MKAEAKSSTCTVEFQQFRQYILFTKTKHFFLFSNLFGFCGFAAQLATSKLPSASFLKVSYRTQLS